MCHSLKIRHSPYHSRSISRLQRQGRTLTSVLVTGDLLTSCSSFIYFDGRVGKTKDFGLIHEDVTNLRVGNEGTNFIRELSYGTFNKTQTKGIPKFVTKIGGIIRSMVYFIDTVTSSTIIS